MKGVYVMSVSKIAWSPTQIIWSMIIGIVVWTAIGFSWFGYGFGWKTPAGASTLANDVLTENLASICVAQAQATTNTDSSLSEFGGLDKWKQRKYVETARWAIMPGNDEPRRDVLEACADKLRNIYATVA
jgi:hypothetical protein